MTKQPKPPAAPPEKAVTVAIKAEDGASNPPVAVPVSGRIKLKGVPSASAGSYKWSTTSARIRLENDTSQVVVVAADKHASPTALAETVRLVFTPAGKAALGPVTHKLGVAAAVFSADAGHSWGYDCYEKMRSKDTDNNETEPTPGPSNDFVSVKVGAIGKVMLKLGGIEPAKVFLKSTNAATCNPKVGQPTAMSTTLEIEGVAAEDGSNMNEGERWLSLPGAPFAGWLAMLILSLGWTAAEGKKAMSDNATLPPALGRIVELLEAGSGPSTREIVAAKSAPNAVAILVERMAGWPPSSRVMGLGVLADLGAPLVRREAGFPQTPGPLVDDPLVVRELVACLGDHVRDVRSASAALLIERVSDGFVRDHSAEILAAITKQPATDKAALLLGKTGAAAAEKVLRGLPSLRDAVALETRAALGRLGDREAEARMIEACEKERNPQKRAQLLSWLGYMATLRSVLFLAREIRTPESYVWVLEARRSMRVHVIEALHRAFPSEQIFWPPPFKPDSDAYYEAVEAWITQNLGVTWSTPRPPFLYEEDAPAAPRP